MLDFFKKYGMAMMAMLIGSLSMIPEHGPVILDWAAKIIGYASLIAAGYKPIADKTKTVADNKFIAALLPVLAAVHAAVDKAAFNPKPEPSEPVAE